MSDAAPPADVLERQNSVAPPEEEAPAPASAAPPTLTVADLQRMVTIITAGCQRGTFRPAELAPVGELHDRLTAYIKSQQTPQ